MPPEEFGVWDMVLAWVFLGVAGGAAIGIGRLMEHYRRRGPR